jgi:carbonic anhydrase
MLEICYRYDPDHPSERRAPGDADEARRRLEDGNRAFASLAVGGADARRVVPIDLEDIGIGVQGGVLSQQPFAVVLGCADARVPTELIFGGTCNELFVVRVAGNILGQEQLGSIDYAVEHLGTDLKLIVVLGHSQCGAVTAAVDAFLTPVQYLGLSSSHQIRSIVNTLFPAVRGAALALSTRWGEEVSARPAYRAALIECSVVLNAAVMASILKETFGAANAQRRVVFGVYDLASRRVHVPGSPGEADRATVCLADAVEAGDHFRQFAFHVAGSAQIRQMLER